jgi:hypothetical protein
VLARFGHLESIPEDPAELGMPPGRAVRLAESLQAHREEACLYRRLATLRVDVPLQEGIGDREWRGVRADFVDACRELGDEALAPRVTRREV